LENISEGSMKLRMSQPVDNVATAATAAAAIADRNPEPR
jgi:hypothetical protein